MIHSTLWRSNTFHENIIAEALEHQAKLVIAKLAKIKAEMKQQEATSVDQHSKATEEIRSLKQLLAQKEAYSGKLVLDFTQVTEDLRVAKDNVKFLEASLHPLRKNLNASKTEKVELRVEKDPMVAMYKALTLQSKNSLNMMFL
ncbi:hypothetical protein A4A49_36451 [Nicotiana attenuata]|uniref:Uncharacterized protein n=1 Tax=Nicotiana attenuata TaxID=49451 RepID=A0A1J6K8J8_NICAT|nr:hypothetical protein A4A49_36451 [Nicotiana attenuata]